MPAGEVHDGTSAGDDSYTLKTFRVSAELLSGITEEVTGQDQFPALGAAVLHDPSLAVILFGCTMHCAQVRSLSRWRWNQNG
jgi:hypothetical protein